MSHEYEWMKNKLGFLLHMEGNDLVLTLDQEFIDACGTAVSDRDLPFPAAKL